jgi:hypothetical protein
MAKAILRVPSAMPGRGDDHHQQRAALGGRLLDDDREIGQPAPASAELLGEVYTEEAGGAEVRPQLGRRFVEPGLLHEVAVAVSADQRADGRAQDRALLGLRDDGGRVHAATRRSAAA